jgi:dimethylglycine dehydrogenase
MTFPNETLPKGRRMRTTALYDRLSAKGAVWGDGFGLEAALWFADGPQDAHEEPTFGRSRAHDYVARECKAVREAVGVTEIANFAKHSIRGADARKFLDYVMAGRVPQPGRINLSPMLTHKGKLYGDLTIACFADDDFMIFGSGAAQEMHRRWFESHMDGYDIQYANESRRYHGIGLSGPNARELLSRITREDVSSEGLRFRDIRRTFIGTVPATLLRLSFSGELGFEIYVEPEYQLKLYEEILEAGQDLGLTHYGLRALMSLRLEKNWGAWTLEFRPDFTAAQSGLDIFINWDKDFIGKEAAVKERDSEPTIKLVTMTIDTDAIDVCNDEAILKDGECVGYVTSGGYAHHLRQSMALGYVPAELAADDTELEVEINGEMYAAKVVAQPLYDPTGARMRG